MKQKVWGVFLWAALSVCAGETAPVKLVAAQQVSPSQISITGRVIPLLAARVGSRISGLMHSLGKADDGQWVDVGLRVKAGQELFSVDQTTFKLNVGVQQAAVKQAEAALADIQAGVRQEQRDALRACIDEIDAQLEEQRLDEKRYENLIKVEGAASQKQLEQVQFQIRGTLARRAAAVARLKEAEAGPTPTAVAVAEARVGQSRAALASAEQDLRDTCVRAPYDGVVTRRFKCPGDYLTQMPFTEVIEVVSLMHLVAEMRLPEAYLNRIVAGQTPITLRSPLLKEPLSLPITRVVPAVDPIQGTFAVWVGLPPDRLGLLTPGAFLQGDVQIGAGGEGVLLPQQAVVSADGKAFVFVAADGRMRRRQVELGDRLTDAVIVKTGVASGEKIVLGSAETLKDGAPLPDGIEK